MTSDSRGESRRRPNAGTAIGQLGPVSCRSHGRTMVAITTDPSTRVAVTDACSRISDVSHLRAVN